MRAFLLLLFCVILFGAEAQNDFHSLRKELIKNNYSGQIESSDFHNARNLILNRSVTKSQSIGLLSSGPENFGGRTRSLCVDQNDGNIIYAGSVSGGLWKTENNGSTWAIVSSFEENLGISSICQTSNGNLYVGTGHFQENSNLDGASSGYSGNGVYVSTDGGNSFSQIPGTEMFDNINEVVAFENSIFIASSEGLFKYNSSLTQLLTEEIQSLSISSDGTIIICSSLDGETYLSTNSGSAFNGISGNAPDQIPSDFGRIEYAIASEKEDGYFKIYASYASSTGKIKGVWTSEDHGVSWNKIAVDYNDYNDPFSANAFTPFSFGNTSVGMYSNSITVNPENNDNIFIGGLDLYSWTNAATPPAGEWNKVSVNSAPETSPLFINSNIHDLVWDKDGYIMYANDGGVGKSNTNGFYPANRNYVTSQFYSVAFSAHGDIIGGSHGNGVLYNDHQMAHWNDYRRLLRGTGFTVDISFRHRDVIFATLKAGEFYRSNDRGQNWSTFNEELVNLGLGDPGFSLGGTYTATDFIDVPNDNNTTDSVFFVPSQNYSVGDEIVVASKSTLDSIPVVLIQSLEYDDTVYYTPGLTQTDTVVGSSIILNGSLYTDTLYYDLGQYNYDLTPYNISLDNTIDLSDTVIVLNNNGSVRDSVVVDSIRLYDHYFAQNGGKIIDLGVDTIATNVAWDTLKIQDIRQSWYAFGMGGSSGVWITRNAKHFSLNGDPDWHKVLDEGAQVKVVKFTPDGQNLFVGTFGGEVYRISGYNDVYTSTPKDSIQKWIDLADTVNYQVKTKLQTELVFVGPGVVTGIGVDPSNYEHVAVTVGGYGGNHVFESTNALSTSGLGSFNAIQGDLPDMPAYDVIIERDHPGVLMVGSEFGLWITDDGGSTWTQNTQGFRNVPVYDVEQSWKTWNEGNYKPGLIYVATHGRGIWVSDTYLGLEENEEYAENKDEVIKAYPNPFGSKINVDLNKTFLDQVRIMVHTLDGKQLKSFNIAGTQTIMIDLSDLTPGVYLLGIQSNEDLQTMKIIKTEQ